MSASPNGYTPPHDRDSELDQLQYLVDAATSHQGDPPCSERLLQRLVKLFHLSPGDPTRVHEVLVELPFRGILTTNYDRLLERALGPSEEDRAVDVQTAAPLILSQAVRGIADSGKSEKVIHLHGTGADPREMVLTSSDYERAYGLAETPPGTRRQSRRPHARTLLSALLTTRRLVFVGFGLRDPILMRILGDVTADCWEWDSPVHYAIMPIDETNASDQRASAVTRRTKYGIDTLFYEVRDDDHSALVATLEEIAGRVRLRNFSPPEVPSRAKAYADEKLVHPTTLHDERAQLSSDYDGLLRARIRSILADVEESDHAD